MPMCPLGSQNEQLCSPREAKVHVDVSSFKPKYTKVHSEEPKQMLKIPQLSQNLP